MDEGETGTRGVEGARERGCGGEEKRDLSGKSEREGEKWRQDEGRGDVGKDCWDRRLGDWTGRALERNALFLREHGEQRQDMM